MADSCQCMLKKNSDDYPIMQGSKRDTDGKNRLLDPVGEGEGGMI